MTNQPTESPAEIADFQPLSEDAKRIQAAALRQYDRLIRERRELEKQHATALQAERERVLEDAAQVVRANCPACGGLGTQHSGREDLDECEFCGRVRRALAQKGGGE